MIKSKDEAKVKLNECHLAVWWLLVRDLGSQQNKSESQKCSIGCALSRYRIGLPVSLFYLRSSNRSLITVMIKSATIKCIHSNDLKITMMKKWMNDRWSLMNWPNFWFEKKYMLIIPNGNSDQFVIAAEYDWTIRTEKTSSMKTTTTTID